MIYFKIYIFGLLISFAILFLKEFFIQDAAICFDDAIAKIIRFFIVSLMWPFAGFAWLLVIGLPRFMRKHIFK